MVPFGEQLEGVVAGLVDPVLFVLGVVQTAPQGAFGLQVELTHQRGAPGVPQRRVGGVDVGHGEHVEIIQMHQVAHGAREFMHHVRVGNVLALGGDAHGQVVAHQPGHQLGVPVGEAVALTEGDGVVGAQLGVVAAAALGDVVVEPGHVQQLGLGQPVEHLAGHREFVALVVVAQAPHVLDHQQRVRVHGVNMEQVVLHHADDAAELRQVLAEDAVAFHAAQLREQRVRAAQQLHEQGGVGRFLAEGVVDQRPRLDQRAHGGGAHSFQVRVLGQQHEHLEDRRRVLAEHVRGADFQIVVAHLETAVERAHVLRLAGAQDHLVEQLQQHLVEH